MQHELRQFILTLPLKILVAGILPDIITNIKELDFIPVEDARIWGKGEVLSCDENNISPITQHLQRLLIVLFNARRDHICAEFVN